jgi:hypothetical protein
MSPSKLAQHRVCQMSKAMGDEHLRQFRNTAWAPPRTVCVTAARQIVTLIWVALSGDHQPDPGAPVESKSGLLDFRQPSSIEVPMRRIGLVLVFSLAFAPVAAETFSGSCQAICF